MSLKIILAVPVFLVLANAAGAAGQRYADLPPGGFVEPPAAGAKIKAPTGGTKLPAVQKAREAANRTPQADKHKGHIEVDSFSLGATQTKDKPGANESLASGADGGATEAAGQRRRYSGGSNFLLGDGSVRNSVSPVGGNETISIGSGSTETAKGGGLNELKLDDTAGAAKASRLGNLGSLQGMGSIGQLAAPPGTGDAAGGQVRNRMFSIVDRTPTAKDGANTGAAGGNKTQTIGIGRTATTAGGGPHVKAFTGNGAAGAARPSSNITMKGSSIRQN